jgi:hypothetical protein
VRIPIPQKREEEIKILFMTLVLDDKANYLGVSVAIGIETTTNQQALAKGKEGLNVTTCTSGCL